MWLTCPAALRAGSRVLVLPRDDPGGEDVREALDVDVRPRRTLHPRGALGPQDVDSSLEQTATERDLVLLELELLDELLQILVGEGAEIGQRVHGAFPLGALRPVKQQSYRGVNLSLRLLPRFAARPHLPA